MKYKDITAIMRGRNTDAIITDVKLIKNIELGEIVVICRDGDKMKQDGDIETSSFSAPVYGFVRIVGNGGTTQQLVAVIARCLDVDCDFEVIDVQKDEEPQALLSYHSRTCKSCRINGSDVIGHYCPECGSI